MTSQLNPQLNTQPEPARHPSQARKPANMALSATRLAQLGPDVLLVDLGVVSPEAALALAQGRPELLLIGLDAAGERLLVLSGQQARALSTADLVGLIESDGRLAGVKLTESPASPDQRPPAQLTA